MFNKTLFLFDIDGTLIHINKAGKKAFNLALENTFGRPNLLDNFSLSGKSDLETFHKVLNKLNKKYKQKYWKKFINCFENILNKESKNYTWNKIAGIENFLNYLINNNGKLALITGNSQIGAAIKLKNCNLYKYFPVGGFGHENQSRKKIAKIALKKSKLYYNTDFKKIFAFGDTPDDIKAGRAINAKMIAVYQGGYSKSDLKRYNPFLLIKNYRNIIKLFEKKYLSKSI